jgi:hypothetical protein
MMSGLGRAGPFQYGGWFLFVGELVEDGWKNVTIQKNATKARIRRHVCHHRHVGELRQRPLPTVGFAAHHRNGGHALHGEGEEDQQRDRSAQRQLVAQGRLQVEACDSGIDSVQRAERGDDDFARGDRGQQADADLPVEAQRTDGGLDEVSDLATTLS